MKHVASVLERRTPRGRFSAMKRGKEAVAKLVANSLWHVHECLGFLSVLSMDVRTTLRRWAVLKNSTEWAHVLVKLDHEGNHMLKLERPTGH